MRRVKPRGSGALRGPRIPVAGGWMEAASAKNGRPGTMVAPSASSCAQWTKGGWHGSVMMGYRALPDLAMSGPEPCFDPIFVAFWD